VRTKLSKQEEEQKQKQKPKQNKNQSLVGQSSPTTFASPTPSFLGLHRTSQKNRREKKV
jgi:hypothetical protein